jgi:5'-AMP-activated protein kinase catalytic alpha subunit
MAARVANNNNRPASVGRIRSNVKGSAQNQNMSQMRKRVGQYLIGDTVGEGTFGKVKLAIHIPTGEKVAVKILEKKRIQDQADVRRVNREIKILKKAKHPNIIQLYEVLDTPNTIYLIMENADG